MSDKKKIGILTFHRAINYGAVLQAFALQEFVMNNFHAYDVEIINFYTDVQDISYMSYKAINNKFKRMLVSTLFHYYGIQNKKDKFDSFLYKYLKLSKRYSDATDFVIEPPQYDIYIVGSDQVFNPKNRYREVYYLNFDKKENKKVSYAASLGVDHYEENEEIIIKKYLSDFDAISCREKQGVNAIEKLGFRAEFMCDPVFLLDVNSWISKLSLDKIKLDFPKKYIFVYDLNGGDRLIRKAKELSKVTELPIYCLTGNLLQRYGIKHIYYNLSPEEFLFCIKNSTFVVTDSFHGTVLSIIFKREFYSFIAVKNTASRIYSILEDLNLNNRIIRDETQIPIGFIDYSNIDEIISSKQCEAKQFLTKIMYNE